MEPHDDGAVAPGPVAPATGDDQVDAALGRLGDLDGLPVDEHPAVFEHVHRGLTAALGTLEAGADATPGARETPARPTTPGS
jgi:hypothetical protein